MFFSLPVSVKNSHPLGYWLTPILVDALSKQVDETGVLYYGKLGLRTPLDEEEIRFHQNLDFIGVARSRVADESIVSDLLMHALNACNRGCLEVRIQECYVCPCGILSIPSDIVTYAREKTFKRSEEKIVCKVCKNEALRASVEKLFYKIKKTTEIRTIKVFPRFYQKEVDELVQQIHEQGIPISRVRETGFVFQQWNIDIEFLWSFLPLVISGYTNERLRVVVTNQVLRQAVVAYLLAIDSLPEFEADLVVCPIIVHPGKAEKWNLDRLRTLGYDGELLRFMLICSLGWNNKQANLFDQISTVEHRRFNLLVSAVNSANGRVYSVQDAIRNLTQQNLVKALSSVFNPESFEFERIKGIF